MGPYGANRRGGRGMGAGIANRGGGSPNANRAANSPGGYIANISDLSNFQVNWDQWECLTQPLYDSAAYAAAGATTIQFFSTPIGQGTAGIGGGPKSLSDTNMQLAGQMPANQMFLISEIEIDFQMTTPTVAAQMPAVFGAQAAALLINDAYIFYRSGNLVLTIGSKPYLQVGPLMNFPPQSVFEVQGALSDATTAGAAFQSRVFYAGSRGTPYSLAPNNLLLVSSQNFGITLNWPEGLQAISNPARIFVTMNGTLYRKAQ